MTTFEKLTKSILIGKTSEGEGIVLKIETDPSHREESEKYFSMSGEVYDIDGVMTEAEGEQRAKEYLEDGELWKDAVQHDRITQSMDEWIESVLNIDGWEHVLGDVTDIGNDQYVMLSSCGQIDISQKFDQWDKLIISIEDLGVILKAWKELHLKTFAKMTPEEIELTTKAVEVFKKYPIFEDEHLSQLIGENQNE